MSMVSKKRSYKEVQRQRAICEHNKPKLTTGLEEVTICENMVRQKRYKERVRRQQYM
jgi:hypothetical protein